MIWYATLIFLVEIVVVGLVASLFFYKEIAMGRRKKTKAVTVYFDETYEEKLEYIRETEGFTSFFTRALDELQMDQGKLDALHKIRALRKSMLTTDA